MCSTSVSQCSCNLHVNKLSLKWILVPLGHSTPFNSSHFFAFVMSNHIFYCRYIFHGNWDKTQDLKSRWTTDVTVGYMVPPAFQRGRSVMWRQPCHGILPMTPFWHFQKWGYLLVDSFILGGSKRLDPYVNEPPANSYMLFLGCVKYLLIIWHLWVDQAPQW